MISFHWEILVLAVFRMRTTGEPKYFADSLRYDNIYGKLIVQNTRLTLAQKSYKIKGACNWNALPDTVFPSFWSSAPLLFHSALIYLGPYGQLFIRQVHQKSVEFNSVCIVCR